MRLITACLIAAHLAAPAAMACQPLSSEGWDDSPHRVKANFDAAQFVVSATVVSLKTVHEAKPPFPDFKMKLERARFRVDRVFKGMLRPGDTFEIDSGVSSCARGVAKYYFVAPVPGKKKAHPDDYAKQWLIYHTTPPHIPNSDVQLPAFEITVSPLSRPLGQAAYDLTVLEKLRGG